MGNAEGFTLWPIVKGLTRIGESPLLLQAGVEVRRVIDIQG